MHPVASIIFNHLDLHNVLSSFYGVSVRVSLLAATGAILAKSVTSKSDSCSKCKRKRGTNDVSDLDLSSGDFRSLKKARIADCESSDEVASSFWESTFVNSDGEADISMDDKRSICKVLERHAQPTLVLNTKGFTPDNTLCSSSSVDSNAQAGRATIVDPRFDFSADTSASFRSINLSPLFTSPFPAKSSYIVPSPRPTYAEDSNNVIEEDDCDFANEKHEWELRWFVCVHHAAFTAATGLSLRREIRRRKTLSRMWRALRKENAVLREENERLTLEYLGFVEVNGKR